MHMLQSVAEIGKKLGNRNYATALHSYEKISREMNVNNSLHKQISKIKDEIN